MRFLKYTAILILFLLPAGTSKEAPLRESQTETFFTEASTGVLLENTDNNMHPVPVRCVAVRSRSADDFNLIPADKDEIAGENNLAINSYDFFSGTQYIFSSFRHAWGISNNKYIIKISDLPPPVNFAA